MKTIDYVTRESWLARRSDFIGASDSPAILGEGYAGRNAFSVYAEKAEGTAPGIETTEAMEVGLRMQPLILSLFEDRTGIQVIDTLPFKVVFSGHADHIGCTLDAEIIEHGKLGVAEAKNVGEYVAADWLHEEPPLGVQIQVQHQLLCTRYSFGYAIGLLGGNRLVWRRIERNEKFIAALSVQLDMFWESVVRREPPAIDGSAATRETLKRLYPHDTGEEIALPIDSDVWAHDLEVAKTGVKKWEERMVCAANKIRAAMGTASVGVLPGGGRYTHRIVNRPGHHVGATSYRTLRREKK